LAEAIYCGCPIVATACPGGLKEMLGDGRYGTLVPVGDAKAMATQLVAALDRGREPPARECADGFDLATSATRYIETCYGTT
jgi:glycosyltransferase involved in cell wall biosynthesis